MQSRYNWNKEAHVLGFQNHSFVPENPCISIFLEGNKDMYMIPSNLLFVHVFLFTLRDHVCVTNKESQPQLMLTQKLQKNILLP